MGKQIINGDVEITGQLLKGDLKALYHLGAYDSVDTSNADYDLVTRKIGYKNAWEATFETGWEDSMNLNGTFPIKQISGAKTPTTASTIVGNGLGNKFGSWTATGTHQIIQVSGDPDWRLQLTGCTTIAQAKAWLQANNVILQYELTSSYTQPVLKNQPLSTLDQNGKNWLRGEYEKQLNLFAPHVFKAGGYYENSTPSWHENSTMCCYRFFLEAGVYTYNVSKGSGDDWFGTIYSSSSASGPTTVILSTGSGNPYVGSFTLTSACYIYFSCGTDKTVMLNEGNAPKPFVDWNGPVMHAIDVEGVLLWQNGNEDASFSEQTISVPDMSAYKYLMFGFKINSSATSITQYFKIKCKNSSGGYAWFSFIDDTSTDTYKRTIKINSMTSITFNEGYRNSSATSNSCIPTTIYGIK